MRNSDELLDMFRAGFSILFLVGCSCRGDKLLSDLEDTLVHGKHSIHYAKKRQHATVILGQNDIRQMNRDNPIYTQILSSQKTYSGASRYTSHTLQKCKIF